MAAPFEIFRVQYSELRLKKLFGVHGVSFRHGHSPRLFFIRFVF